MWTAIESYLNRGFEGLQLGRNSFNKQEGLRRYKKSWGASEGTTKYYRFNLKTDQIDPVADAVFGWHNQIFRKLPLPMTKLAGRILYKHIA